MKSKKATRLTILVWFAIVATGGDMNQTIKAILARCDGDLNAAINYCEQIAYVYPNLRTEYRGHRETFLNQMQREVSIASTRVARA